MLLWHFVRAVCGTRSHFCGGKGIKGRASSLSHSQFTALQSVTGQRGRQGILMGVTHTWLFPVAEVIAWVSVSCTHAEFMRYHPHKLLTSYLHLAWCKDAGCDALHEGLLNAVSIFHISGNMQKRIREEINTNQVKLQICSTKGKKEKRPCLLPPLLSSELSWSTEHLTVVAGKGTCSKAVCFLSNVPNKSIGTAFCISCSRTALHSLLP